MKSIQIFSIILLFAQNSFGNSNLLLNTKTPFLLTEFKNINCSTFLNFQKANSNTFDPTKKGKIATSKKKSVKKTANNSNKKPVSNTTLNKQSVAKQNSERDALAKQQKKIEEEIEQNNWLLTKNSYNDKKTTEVNKAKFDAEREEFVRLMKNAKNLEKRQSGIVGKIKKIDQKLLLLQQEITSNATGYSPRKLNQKKRKLERLERRMVKLNEKKAKKNSSTINVGVFELN